MISNSSRLMISTTACMYACNFSKSWNQLLDLMSTSAALVSFYIEHCCMQAVQLAHWTIWTVSDLECDFVINSVFEDDQTLFQSIFSNSTKEEAICNQYEFCIQWVAGPPLYGQRRGSYILLQNIVNPATATNFANLQDYCPAAHCSHDH